MRRLLLLAFGKLGLVLIVTIVICVLKKEPALLLRGQSHT